MISLKSKIENNPFHLSPVEIIIPFHNEHSRVAKLIDSIFKTVLDNFYLITLVDDCSLNKGFVKEFSKTPGVRIFRQEKQKGFGAAVNLALSNPFSVRIDGMKSSIPWVIIMHSDVVVEDNQWLGNMGNSMMKLKNSGVKMISPKTNNPVEQNLALKGDKGLISDDVVLKEGFLPMYCVMAHRELFSKVGQLKEFPYAGTEAEEYALRMRSKGYLQAVCGSSWVNHFGRASLAHYDNHHKIQKILQKTKNDFKK